VGIADKNPETIDISWLQGFFFTDGTTTALQIHVY